ncbi:hypothetical protein QL285_028715 [Trifolium repens]|nr:hypothetical protein QL285_028715 [Trifolium repens]
MYLSPGTWVRFPRKAKTPIEKGVGEDREVAVPGTPKARAVTSFYVTARAFGVPGSATSRSSPTPFSIGVFAFRGNGLDMYLSPGTWVRFPRKAKTPIEKGVGEEREVAVPGTPKARAVTRTGAKSS